MPTLKGKLLLTLVDVNGKSIKDRVTVQLEHTESSHTKTIEDGRVTGPFTISGLHQAPKNTYLLTVRPKSYHAARRFVNIGNETTPVSLVLPIRSECAEAKLPRTFATLKKRHPELADMLERSPQVRKFVGLSGAKLWDALSDFQKAALLNIKAKALVTKLPSGEAILPVVTLRRVEQDRCFANVPKVLVDGVEGASQDDFEKVDGSLHPAPPHFEARSSYKSPEPFGNIQFTFFQGTSKKVFAADIDIDNASGFLHVIDVIKNTLTNGKTHPYDIHEILVQHQGLDPGYTLSPKP